MLRKLSCLLFALVVSLNIWADKKPTVVLNGVEYTIDAKICNGIAVAAAIKKGDPRLEILQIPSEINYNGGRVPVSAIAKDGFKGCKNLKTVILPNSITQIGVDAFKDCENLTSVILPDVAYIEIEQENFGSGGTGPFKGCKRLRTIRGNNTLLPDYVLTSALRKCNDVPFFYRQDTGSGDMPAVSATWTEAAPPFSEYADSKVRQPMELWEKRKPYESADDYMQRVTDASREARLKEYIAQAREEYLATFAPSFVSGQIKYYDPDYNVFTIEIPSYGEVYAKVPKDESDRFRSRWSNVAMQPRFGILDDRLAVLSCRFVLDGKTYESESVYTDEADRGYADVLRPLSELIAENTAGAPAEVTAPGDAPKSPAVVDPVDLTIPSTGVDDKHTFALIIGNEHYQGNIKGVPYAANDAQIFARYCKRTLGLPDANVKLLTDATMGQMTNAIEELKNKARAVKGDARIIFYYSGHGKPDDKDRQAYMVPVDASPYSNRTNYSLSELYRELSESEAQLVTVFLDACFSGATRNDDMLVAARAMRQVPREDTPQGNMVVFTAASDAETAYPAESKGHGVFTYALLEKLQSTQGNVSLGQLADHISRTVTDMSLSANRPQTPKVLVSPSLTGWSDIQLRKK